MTEPGDLTARVATTADSPEVISILVDAFHDDPAWSWAFQIRPPGTGQHQRLWKLFVDGALRYPWVWQTLANTATSVWIPPGGHRVRGRGDSRPVGFGMWRETSPGSADPPA